MSYHKNQCFNKGKIAEAKFCKLTGAKAGTAKQDVKDHIDCFMPDGKAVDVKSYRKCHSKGYILVEIKNVAGDHGWASRQSKADLIALEFEKGFAVVPKEELRIFAQQQVLKHNPNAEVWRKNSISPEAGLYKLCGREKDRKGKLRKDVFTYIKKSDLAKLSWDFYPYTT